MAVYKLRIMPLVEAETRAILAKQGFGPTVRGSGPDDYVCPKCNNVVGKSVTLANMKQIANGAFVCTQCRTNLIV